MSAQSDPESGADWDEGKDGYVEQDHYARMQLQQGIAASGMGFSSQLPQALRLPMSAIGH